jgi:D-alanyl-D-alanine carboxypeptidase
MGAKTIRTIRTRRVASRGVVAVSVALLAGLVLALGCGGDGRPAEEAARATPSVSVTATPAAGTVTATPEPPATVSPTPAPTRPPSDLLRFVGKTGEPLPQDYVPPDLERLPPAVTDGGTRLLRAEAAAAFVRMAAAARAEGLTLVVVSAYRSYAEQAVTYQLEVARYGKVQADRQVALPGRSEHQLGTTVDLSTPRLGNRLDDGLADLPEGRWLEAHAWEYGFVLSYPDGQEEITGYRYEPWHYRYVGVEVARFIRQSGRTSTEVLRAYQTVGVDPVLPAGEWGGGSGPWGVMSRE